MNTKGHYHVHKARFLTTSYWKALTNKNRMEIKKKVNTYLKLDVNRKAKSMQQHQNTRLQANRMGNLEFLQDLDYKSVHNILLLFRQQKWGRMNR